VKWDYYNSQGDVKQTVNIDGLFVLTSTFKSIFTTLQVKSPQKPTLYSEKLSQEIYIKYTSKAPDRKL